MRTRTTRLLLDEANVGPDRLWVNGGHFGGLGRIQGKGFRMQVLVLPLVNWKVFCGGAE